MRSDMKYCLAFVLLSAALAPAVQVKGKITGTVVDEQGTPVKHIILEYEQLDGMWMLLGQVPMTETDENGHFSIDISVRRLEDGTLDGGRWEVRPRYDSGRTGYYPPDRIRFYRTEHNFNAQEIEVTPEAPNAVVEIKLGPKAGVLIGKITDAVTGHPIEPYATIKIAWASDPTAWFGGNTIENSGKYRLLVPPDTELVLKAMTTARKYKPYRYEGVITVGSGQEKVLDIQLQPEDK
jgi:hypothetical protein